MALACLRKGRASLRRPDQHRYAPAMSDSHKICFTKRPFLGCPHAMNTWILQNPELPLLPQNESPTSGHHRQSSLGVPFSRRRAILSTSLPILLSPFSLILFHTRSLTRQVACPKMRAHSLLWLLGTAVEGLNILITVSGCCPSQVKGGETWRLANPHRTTTASPLPTLASSTRS